MNKVEFEDITISPAQIRSRDSIELLSLVTGLDEWFPEGILISIPHAKACMMLPEEYSEADFFTLDPLTGNLLAYAEGADHTPRVGDYLRMR